jgi:alcohol dehydrogenase (cytochrome c)
VLTGELSGMFEAFDAQTGRILFTHDVGGPVGGGVVSYEAGGKQHIAVVSGYVGSFNDFSPELGGANPTVTVFALK